MANFHELINRNTPTLVDFYADWCGPCKMMPPILTQVKNELGSNVNILKVDVDKNNKAANKYGIRSIPTLILFKNGKIIWRKSGVAQANEITREVRKIA
ncbi:thioredoxin [Marinoscillum furvescens]|uniref:Thioredoxin n=1 Tax=Marinoscillum furvescens DSM 4134 TaxID=1122208 RepID=A0A3D9L3W8_MARFU|nr:thioredoxin [Marinoscillum furvescens]RED97964.1 thioredoxin [Marinoscillum furvescens DSM 4134]